MAKTDGLIWQRGDDGWKYIPTGTGYVQRQFSNMADAVIRIEGEVKAGFGGAKIDFRNVNELLQALPAGNFLSAGAAAQAPSVLWAGVHPTDLTQAIIVWNTPVVILNVDKISPNDSVSVNGRVMTVRLNYPVAIDGSRSAQVFLYRGAVGAYSTITDQDKSSPVSNTAGMYAATNNDSAVGNDMESQTKGDPIPAFATAPEYTIPVSCVMTYTVEDANQGSASCPHQIWGVSYCLWGTTVPMDLFPFGQGIEVDPGSLSPPSGTYSGVVKNYAGLGEGVSISVSGVSGPLVTLASLNGGESPIQAGQVVTFTRYGCDTVCDNSNQTVIASADAALAYVDEDIIKPYLRTMPVHTFLTTTYFFSTIPAVTQVDISSFTSTYFHRTDIGNVWTGLSGTEYFAVASGDELLSGPVPIANITEVTANAYVMGSYSPDPTEGKLVASATDVTFYAADEACDGLSGLQPDLLEVPFVQVVTDYYNFVPADGGVINGAVPLGTDAITKIDIGTPSQKYAFDAATAQGVEGEPLKDTFLKGATLLYGGAQVNSLDAGQQFVTGGTGVNIPNVAALAGGEISAAINSGSTNECWLDATQIGASKTGIPSVQIGTAQNIYTFDAATAQGVEGDLLKDTFLKGATLLYGGAQVNSLDAGQQFVTGGTGTNIPNVTAFAEGEINVAVNGGGTNECWLDATQIGASKTGIPSVQIGTPIDIGLPPTGTSVISGTILSGSLTSHTTTFKPAPATIELNTGMFTAVELQVCAGDGTPATLFVLTAAAAGTFNLGTSITVTPASDVSFSYLSGAAGNYVTNIPIAGVTPTQIPNITTGVPIQVVTDIPYSAVTTKSFTPAVIAPGLGPSVITALSSGSVSSTPVNIPDGIDVSYTAEAVTDMTLVPPTLKVIPNITTGVPIQVVTDIPYSAVTTKSFTPAVIAPGLGPSVITALSSGSVSSTPVDIPDDIDVSYTAEAVTELTLVPPTLVEVPSVTAGSISYPITDIPVLPPDNLPIGVVSSTESAYVMTSINTVPITALKAAVTIQTQSFSYFTNSINVVDAVNTSPQPVYAATSYAQQQSVLLPIPEAVDASIIGFSPVPTADQVDYMQPSTNTMTLAIVDPLAPSVNIIAPSGPIESQVQLLYSSPYGDVKLIGVGDPLKNYETTKVSDGEACLSAKTVSTYESGDAEAPDEVILLSPKFVNKSMGNADTCPCFDGNVDIAGSEAATRPQDNSAILNGSFNPCTLRVRRLQLADFIST